jgi:hypothetical protein
MRCWWSRSARRAVFCPRSVVRAFLWSIARGRRGMSSSGALACRFALRLATPRRLAAALAAAAPSDDIPRLPVGVCYEARRPNIGVALARAHAPTSGARSLTSAHALRANEQRRARPFRSCVRIPAWRSRESGGANHGVQLQDLVGRRVRGPRSRFSKRARGGDPRPSRARERS